MEIPEKVGKHWRVFDEIEKQTDRGAAIIGASYLEDRLDEAIRSRFVPGNKTKRDILKAGSLASFYSKIDMAFLLGFVGPEAHRDLHKIRKIRNRFAHVVEPLDFNDSWIADKCRTLFLGDIVFAGEEPPTEPRKQFLTAVWNLYNFIWAEMCQKKEAPPAAAEVTP